MKYPTRNGWMRCKECDGIYRHWSWRKHWHTSDCPPSKAEEKKCVRLRVPKDCCYVEFMPKQPRPIKGNIKTAYSHSVTCIQECKKDVSFMTCRGEQVILDFDKHDRIIGIELLGSKKAVKPCQN